MKEKHIIVICLVVSMLSGTYCLGYTKGRKDQKLRRKTIVSRSAKERTMLQKFDNTNPAYKVIENTADVIGQVALALGF
ncbi:MAG: hypothetical protein JRJ39_00045 [Deltaproteobacteria bacterium]|nr:hypothetical protein [Deltaproteobacteria bacterium]